MGCIPIGDMHVCVDSLSVNLCFCKSFLFICAATCVCVHSSISIKRILICIRLYEHLTSARCIHVWVFVVRAHLSEHSQDMALGLLGVLGTIFLQGSGLAERRERRGHGWFFCQQPRLSLNPFLWGNWDRTLSCAPGLTKETQTHKERVEKDGAKKSKSKRQCWGENEGTKWGRVREGKLWEWARNKARIMEFLIIIISSCELSSSIDWLQAPKSALLASEYSNRECLCRSAAFSAGFVWEAECVHVWSAHKFSKQTITASTACCGALHPHTALFRIILVICMNVKTDRTSPHCCVA